jgi:hypothetical protein
LPKGQAPAIVDVAIKTYCRVFGSFCEQVRR